ncbi:hypothetical protein I4U23_027338 [Adineta vaga]|nr:hypothetical protein I4U23_027338 [Adineta vaga]
MLRVLPRNELVPIKKSSQISIDDTVLYGPPADSVRGVVILIGSEEECFVSMREHANLVAQLAQVNEENMLLHSTWMPRPVDKQTIEYFIYVGKTLSNYVDEVSDDGDESLDKGDVLDYICTALGMTEAELRACAGKTLLSTARQVIGTKYPGLSTTFADVAKEHVQAVADYACLMHPLEKKANDMPKIKKAMGNVFATRKHFQKMKIGLVSMDNSVANSDSDASA